MTLTCTITPLTTVSVPVKYWVPPVARSTAARLKLT
jgi:hypothetical protein